MQHNPQYRPPSGPRALPGLAAVARVWAAAGQHSGPHTHTLVWAAPDGPRRQPSKAEKGKRQRVFFATVGDPSLGFVGRAPVQGLVPRSSEGVRVRPICTDGGTTGTAEDEHHRRVHGHQQLADLQNLHLATAQHLKPLVRWHETPMQPGGPRPEAPPCRLLAPQRRLLPLPN